MRRLTRTPALVLLLLSVLVGCSATSGGAAQAVPSTSGPERSAAPLVASAKHSPEVVLSPAGQEPTHVRVEVVSRDADRERGLMFRKQLDQDAGMLFLFERPQQLTFWMHNTYLPLDMIFITSDMSVLGVVENATPETDAPRRVTGDSQYVLEVNAGFCRRHGIEQGARVSFVNLPAESPR